METIVPVENGAQSYSPHLKTVLKTYQLSAVKSLQGPSSTLLDMDCKGLIQGQANYHRFSPPPCTGNCGIEALPKHSPIKEVEKRESSPALITSSCKDLRADKLHEDSDDDPQEWPKVCERRELEFQIPILTAPDQSCSERCETVLEGERISCFVVGGERRLCLPQILNTVLQVFSLPQINQVCDELQIYCSRCTRDQLDELKLSGILPRNAPSCGLITQSDAERLVSALLAKTEEYTYPRPDKDDLAEEKKLAVALDAKKEAAAAAAAAGGGDKEAVITRFKVYHECFGKCKGIFDVESFASEDSPCIQCLDCGRRLSPQRFVRHAHRSLENRTCHWGFDSNNWRTYLLLSRDQQHYNKIANLFRDLKERHLVPNSKRKLDDMQFESERLMKKLKKDIGRDEFAGGLYNGNGLGLYHPATAAAVNDPYLRMQWAVFEMAAREASAFRPWNPAGTCKHRESSPLVPAYLSRGPPVLQHPERVVPLSECERFEPHYQPNVALAPIPAPPPPPLSHPGMRAFVPPPPTAVAATPVVVATTVAAAVVAPAAAVSPLPPPPLPAVAPSPPPSAPHRPRRQPRCESPDVRLSESPESVMPATASAAATTTSTTTTTPTPAPAAAPASPKIEPSPEARRKEEEVSNAAVTSTTSTPAAETPQLDRGNSSSPECGANHDSLVDLVRSLEERISGVDVPEDTLELIRRLSDEVETLRRQVMWLQSELRQQKQQQKQPPQPQQQQQPEQPQPQPKSPPPQQQSVAPRESSKSDAPEEKREANKSSESAESERETKKDATESPKEDGPVDREVAPDV